MNDFALFEEMEWRRNQIYGEEEEEEKELRLYHQGPIDYDNNDDFHMIDIYQNMIDVNGEENNDSDEGYKSTDDDDDEVDFTLYNVTCHLQDELYEDLAFEELTTFRYSG